jgi:hypothetical protein
LNEREIRADIPSKVANASGVFLYDNAVYKGARLAIGKHKSRKRRILRIGVVMIVLFDVVRMVVAVVMSAGG